MFVSCSPQAITREGLIEVMTVLSEAGGGLNPEFLSTHPSPDNRLGRIREAIESPDTVCP